MYFVNLCDCSNVAEEGKGERQERLASYNGLEYCAHENLKSSEILGRGLPKVNKILYCLTEGD